MGEEHLHQQDRRGGRRKPRRNGHLMICCRRITLAGMQPKQSFCNMARLAAEVPTLDSANHGTVTGPFLRVGEVGHRIQVGCDEQAARILRDAQCRSLDLVVVYVAIKSDYHRTHLPAGLSIRCHGRLTLG